MRLFQIFFVFIILIIASLTALLGTHTGNQYIISTLNNTQLPLQLDLKKGTIFHDAQWNIIDWQGQVFQLAITDLDYEIDLACLLSAELCVNHIKAGSVSYSMSLVNPANTLFGIDLDDTLSRMAKLDDQLSNNDWQLNIPLPITVNNIDIHDISVVVANTQIVADRLSAAVNLFGRDIFVSHLMTEKVFVEVQTDSPEQQVTSGVPKPKTETSEFVSNANKQLELVEDLLNEFELYQVSIPLRVDVESATLVESKLQVNDLLIDFDSIELIGFIDAGEVQLDKLVIAMPQANTSLNGSILLQQGYPMYAKVKTILKQPELLDQLVIDVKANGSLDKLNIMMTTEGQINTRTNASLSPLKVNLPFEIDAQWQKLTWPLVAPAYINTMNGKLSLQGNLDEYAINVAGMLEIDNIPSLDLVAKGTGNLHGLSLNHVKAKTLGGNISASGGLNWHNGIYVSSKISVEDIELARYWPEVILQPNGVATVDFNLEYGNENTWQVDVYDINFGADFKGYPLTLTGQLALDQELHWQLDNFSLSHDKDSIKLDGVINETFELSGEIKVLALTPYVTEANGSAFGYFNIVGEKDKPWFSFDLFSDNLIFKNNELLRADIDGRVSLTARPEGVVSVKGKDLIIADHKINIISLDYNADKSGSEISLNVADDNNNGLLAITGFWQGDTWLGKVNKGRINSEFGNWLIDPDVTFSFDDKNQYLSVSQHCWNEKISTLCLGFAGKLGQADKFAFNLANYDINELGLVTPENIEVEGLLNIDSKITWQKSEPIRVASQIAVTDASLLIYNEDQSSLANFDNLTMDVDLDESSLTAKVNINSHELGGMTTDIRIDDLFGERELSGELNVIDIDLTFIEPLIYQVDILNGVVTGAGVVDGTLNKPEIIGQFNLDNGYLSGDGLPITLEHFQVSIESSGEQASLTGTAHSGNGLAKVVGNLSWGDQFNYEMLIHGNDFEFDDDKGVKLNFSPNINIKGNNTGAKIKGDIIVPYALIRVEELPQSAIQVSNDVIIIDADDTNNQQDYPLDVEVNIKLLNDVKIDSFGLESNIIGDVNIALDEDGNLYSDGMLQLENGRYRSFGQDLYIRKGQVVFSGAIENPYINVEAIRNTELTEDNVIVGVRLIGPVKKPVFSIFSEPEMQQTRMISYLLRGRDVNTEDETSQDVVIMTMLVGSSLGQGKGVISFLGDTLGVKDFAIDTRGQGNDTRVEVSGYVLPGVQIRYGIGLFSALSEVVVRYEIIPKLYLELVTGVDSAVDLYYEFSR